MSARVASVAVLLTGCSALKQNHSSDPQTCRERAAYHLAVTYPDPNNLTLVIAAVCSDAPPVIPTTTLVIPTTLAPNTP